VGLARLQGIVLTFLLVVIVPLLLNQRANQLSDTDCFELCAFIFQFKIIEYMVFGAVEKNGSFGFAKCRLVCRAKPNVPLVRLVKNFKIFCAVEKK
jgi:hypothetical protein